MHKQIIIARKDLNMSPGKLASQVSHGSMAFLTWMIRNKTNKIIVNQYRAWDSNGKPMYYLRNDLNEFAEMARMKGENYFYADPLNPEEPLRNLKLSEPEILYKANLSIDKDLYEQWINGEFTKCVLQAKNKNQLLKAKTMAEELGMEEGKDFFCIYDSCRTELEPEEDGRTLTVIGFRPMDSELIDKIGKNYQLYK